ncbi:MAG: hypothetical protein IGS38_18300 [Synechococcales cyanobacterium M58_A2018_015]|nr:hypothetical protein [Synechococcales cyanobacterium M58_A2018_015]
MMKRILPVLTALVTATTGIAATATAQTVDLPLGLIPLDPADSTSALSLDGVESRRASLDFQMLFLPNGAGGERNASEFEYYEPMTLVPMDISIDTSTETGMTQLDDDAVPTYARVEPNRSIRTQTDPQRLMVVTPWERSQTVSPR